MSRSLWKSRRFAEFAVLVLCAVPSCSAQSNPLTLAYQGIGAPDHIVFRDSYAYVTTPWFFVAFDISDPSNWEELYRHEHEPATSSYRGSPADEMAIIGDSVFVSVQNAVNVYNIADPAAPRFKSKWAADGSLMVRFWENQMWMFGSGGLRIYDLENGTASPALVQLPDFPSGPLGFAFDATRVYFSAVGQALWICERTEAATPSVVGTVATENDYRGFYPLLQYYLLAVGGRTLDLLNVRDPSNVVFNPLNSLLGTAVPGAVAVSEDRTRAYVLSEDPNYPPLPAGVVSSATLSVLDISSLPEVSVVASATIDFKLARAIEALRFHNGLLFGYGRRDGRLASLGVTGVVVIDMATPEAPEILNRIPPSIRAEGIAVARDRAFVVDFYAGLLTFDVGDPRSPRVTARLPLPGTGTSFLKMSGNYAYIADGDLQMVDVSDPDRPSLAGRYSVPGNASRLEVFGDLVYLIDNEANELRIIDVRDKLAPREIGSLSFPLSIVDLALIPRYNLLGVVGRGGGYGQLYITDVQDSVHPRLLSAATIGNPSAQFPDPYTVPAAIAEYESLVPNLGLPYFVVGCNTVSSVSGNGIGFLQIYRINPDGPVLVPSYYGTRSTGPIVSRVLGLPYPWMLVLTANPSDLQFWSIVIPESGVRTYAYSEISPQDVAIQGEWVYVASRREGLVVLHNSDPLGPGMGTPTPTPSRTPTPTPTATPTWTPTPTRTPAPDDVGIFILDDYGAVHTGGAANGTVLTGGPYFGWNIARAMALVHGLPARNAERLGIYVLDGYGAVHSLSASRPAQQFYFLPEPGDVAVDLEVFQKNLVDVPGDVGYYVLDRTGKLWPAGIASWDMATRGSITPSLNGNTERAVDLTLADPTGTRGWILDNMGNVYPFGGATDPSFPTSAQSNWMRLARVGEQLARMDASGVLEWSEIAPEGWELPMIDGNLAVDLQVQQGYGLIALDRFGALHGSSGAILPSPGSGPPYFGFEIARAFEMWITAAH